MLFEVDSVPALLKKSFCGDFLLNWISDFLITIFFLSDNLLNWLFSYVVSWLLFVNKSSNFLISLFVLNSFLLCSVSYFSSVKLKVLCNFPLSFMSKLKRLFLFENIKISLFIVLSSASLCAIGDKTKDSPKLTKPYFDRISR